MDSHVRKGEPRGGSTIHRTLSRMCRLGDCSPDKDERLHAMWISRLGYT
jgi:hypothetical protein